MDFEAAQRGEVLAEGRARLDKFAAEVATWQGELASDYSACSPDTVRKQLVATVLVAAGYVRQTMAALIGDLDTDARADVEALLAAAPVLDDGDTDEIGEAAARLLADVWIAGHLAGGVDPQDWPAEALPRLRLQVVAAARASGEVRDELDEAFGITDDEPGR
jgi:hypothetical protein